MKNTLPEIRAFVTALWWAMRPGFIMRRAPFMRRIGAQYRRKLGELVRTEPMPMHLRTLDQGNYLLLADKDQPWMHRTLLVVIPAYLNRHGQWVPPYTVDATGEYLGLDREYRKMLGQKDKA